MNTSNVRPKRNIRKVLLIVLLLALNALLILAPRGVNRSVSELRQELKDPDPTVREEAATGLYGLGAKAHEAIPDLLLALDDEHIRVKTLAGFALIEIGEPSVKPVISLLTEPERGKQAHNVVVQMRDLAIDELVNATKDENEELRALTAEALGRIAISAHDDIIAANERVSRGEATLELLFAKKEIFLGLLDDSNRTVRFWATTSLGLFRERAQDALPKLRLLMAADSDSGVQYAATMSIKQIEAEE